jgi:hypothetical protein
VNQAYDYLNVVGMKRKGLHGTFHLEVGEPHKPDNVQKWYPTGNRIVETVPIVLHIDSQTTVEIR